MEIINISTHPDQKYGTFSVGTRDGEYVDTVFTGDSSLGDTLFGLAIARWLANSDIPNYMIFNPEENIKFPPGFMMDEP